MKRFLGRFFTKIGKMFFWLGGKLNPFIPSVVPASSTYEIPGGIDTKIYFNDKVCGIVQSVSFIGGKGELILLGGPGDKFVKEILSLRSFPMLKIVSTTSSERQIHFNQKIDLETHHMRWGVSIDDLVIETVIPFSLV